MAELRTNTTTSRRATARTSTLTAPVRREPVLGAQVLRRDPRSADDVLTMQRRIGNQAVLRQLARPASPQSPRAVVQRKDSGIKQSSVVGAFASEGVTYFKDAANKTKPINEFATHLVDKANAELKAVDAFEATHSFDVAGASPDYLAIFSRTAWNITIYTSNFSKRAGVTKVGDLTVEEAATLAGAIMHEMRHAEQYSRIARVLAAESAKTSAADIADEIVAKTKIKRDTALLAAGKPLAASKATKDLVDEAKDWESITVGRHADYKANILNWGNECDAARDLAAAVTAANLDATRSGLDTQITKWKGATRGPFVDAHITTIEAIKDKGTMDNLALKHLKKIKPQWAKVEAAWTPVASDWATDSEAKKLKKLREVGGLLRDFSVILYAAYRDYLHEKDAFETGDSVTADFKKLANKKK